MLLRDLAVRDGSVEAVESPTAGADDELPDAALRRHAVRILGREPLVDVLVAIQDDVRPGGVEGSPEGVEVLVGAVLGP